MLTYHSYCPDITRVTDCKNNWSWKVPAEVNNIQETNGEHVRTDTPQEARKPQRNNRTGDASESEPAWMCLKFLKSTNSFFRNTAKMKDFQ